MKSLLVHLKPLLKKFYFFFSYTVRINGKNVNFGDKKIKQINFYKSKKVIKIHGIDVNKILVSKEELHCSKTLSSTLLNTMMMMLSHHYA